jgi:lipopolysaccharide transport system permease protein
MSIPPLPETSYSANSEVRHFRSLMKQTLQSCWMARELAWRLAVRDLQARYRASFLGILWALGPSLVTMFTFSLLQQQQILNVQTGAIPYPVYILFGTILWEMFTGGLTNTLGEIRTALGILSKVNLPREAFIIAGLYKLIFDTTLKCIPLMILLLLYGVPLALTFPLAILPALALMGLGLFMALLLLPLTLLVEDVSRLLTAVLSFGMFVTPVLYPMPTTGILSIIAALNPITPFLNTARALLFGADNSGFLTIPPLSPTGLPLDSFSYAGDNHTYSIALLFGLLLIPLIFLGLILYRLAMPIVIERLSN